MKDEPGSRLDFSNVISFLLPGYTVVLFIVAVGDLINIAYHHFILQRDTFPALIKLRSLDTAQATLFIVASLGAAYYAGLIFDMWAHARTVEMEEKAKNKVYAQSIKNYKGLVKIKEFNDLFENDLARTCLIIEALFNQAASSEAWSRHNWSWSFFEAARQFTYLTNWWIAAPIFLYCSAILVGLFTGKFDGVDINASLSTSTIIASVAIAIALVGINVSMHEAIEKYRDSMCEFYYDYKANFVFGYLMQKSLLDRRPIEISSTGESPARLNIVVSSSDGVETNGWKKRAERERVKHNTPRSRSN
jgi:hypothetical protein